MLVWGLMAACLRTLPEQPLPLKPFCSTSPIAWPLGSGMQTQKAAGLAFKAVSNAEEVGHLPFTAF